MSPAAGGRLSLARLLDPDILADPYPLYRRMRDEYPLYFHAPTRAWILSRYEDVRAALTNPAFTTRSYARQTEPLLGRTLIQLDGREHALHRGLLTPSFREGSIRERGGRWYVRISTASGGRREMRTDAKSRSEALAAAAAIR